MSTIAGAGQHGDLAARRPPPHVQKKTSGDVINGRWHDTLYSGPLLSLIAVGTAMPCEADEEEEAIACIASKLGGGGEGEEGIQRKGGL